MIGWPFCFSLPGPPASSPLTSANPSAPPPCLFMWDDVPTQKRYGLVIHLEIKLVLDPVPANGFHHRNRCAARLRNSGGAPPQPRRTRPPTCLRGMTARAKIFNIELFTVKTNLAITRAGYRGTRFPVPVVRFHGAASAGCSPGIRRMSDKKNLVKPRTGI